MVDATHSTIHCITDPVPGLDRNLTVGTRGCLNGQALSECERLSGRGMEVRKVATEMLDEKDEMADFNTDYDQSSASEEDELLTGISRQAVEGGDAILP